MTDFKRMIGRVRDIINSFLGRLKRSRSTTPDHPECNCIPWLDQDTLKRWRLTVEKELPNGGAVYQYHPPTEPVKWSFDKPLKEETDE